MKVRLGIATLGLIGLGVAMVSVIFQMAQNRGKPGMESIVEGIELDWFSDETSQWGVTEKHDSGPFDETYFMPQILGSGIALFDADNDGRLDLLVLNNGGPKGVPNRLYLQKEPGRFQMAAPGHGLDFAGYCMGVATGDLNRDGFIDVLVTEYQGVRVFLNRGNGTFSALDSGKGVKNPAWGTSCVISDFDRDGWPDLVVTNYVGYDPTWPCTSPSGRREFCPPHAFSGQVTRFWKNLGPANKNDSFSLSFEDCTAKGGLATRAGPGLGLVVTDLNGDGWLDILVANDGKPNHLWIHQPDGSFNEEALTRGIAYNSSGKAQAGMGITVADFQKSGRFDVFMTHLAEETHTFWKQTSAGMFRDRTGITGLLGAAHRSTGFGVVAADFDLDGEIDLVMANGRISAREESQAPEGNRLAPYFEKNQAFKGIGKSQFKDISTQLKSLCGVPNVARGLAVGDLNGDGLPDLVVSRVGECPMVLINRTTDNPGCAIVLSEGPLGVPSAGELLEKNGPNAGRKHGIGMGGSYLSASQAAVFLKRSLDASPGKFEITWQDGLHEVFEVSLQSKQIVLRKGKGERVNSSGGQKP